MCNNRIPSFFLRRNFVILLQDDGSPQVGHIHDTVPDSDGLPRHGPAHLREVLVLHDLVHHRPEILLLDCHLISDVSFSPNLVLEIGKFGFPHRLPPGGNMVK